MDGATSRAGGVAALTGFANPIAIARLVLERTPHVLLAGPGAEAFAAAQGLPRVPDAYFTRRTGATADVAVPSPGTVGAVALDRDGRLAAATSTGGVTGKLPGRVGDSPIVGAGTYADDRCAVSATGAGEFFVRTVFAHRVAVAVSAGVPVAQATQRALDGVTSLGGSGGCVAVDASGAIAMPFSTVGMFRAVGDAGGGREGAIFGEALAAI
jgi:isoaspartyl peptidase/L-asparaginase-like protein (Ntn-hydrolase superfamily)